MTTGNVMFNKPHSPYKDMLMLAVSCVRSCFNLNDVKLRADGSAEL